MRSKILWWDFELNFDMMYFDRGKKYKIILILII